MPITPLPPPSPSTSPVPAWFSTMLLNNCTASYVNIVSYYKYNILTSFATAMVEGEYLDKTSTMCIQ